MNKSKQTQGVATLGRLLFLASLGVFAVAAARNPQIGYAATNTTVSQAGSAPTQDAPATPAGAASAGAAAYQANCAICHQSNRQGLPPTFPSLVGVNKKYTDAEITGIIHNGKGRMPALANVDAATAQSIIDYLKSADLAPDATTPAPSTFGNRAEVEGAKVYDGNCAICHGEDLLGAPSNYPVLLGVRTRLTDQQILSNIHNGKGRMPAFPNLSAADTAAILRFLGKPNAAKPDAAKPGV